MSKEQLEASLKTFELLLQIFGVVLAIATVCVTGFGVKAWLLSNQIKNLQHVEDLKTQGDIAQINKDAAATRERTSQADERAAQANERAAKLEAKAAQLQLDLEKERAARLPRSISAPNRTKLLACLNSGPKGPVIVVPKTFDEEAESYAKQIHDTLVQAQFEIRPLTGPRPFGFGVAGAFLLVNDLANLPPHAGHIQSCFLQIGVELLGYSNPKDVPDSGVVVIAISSKP
jgi:hypothetical protein